MGQYNKAILTAAGENLIARTLAGEIQLYITKAKTSNYTYPSDTDFKALTDMQGFKQTVSDPVTAVYNDTMIQTRALFGNEEIESTYYIHNIGLYAIDGTAEVLFCIVTAETPDEMPQYNGVASTSYIYNIQNVVQDAAQLNITVNPSGTATIQDVLERVDATGGDISETVIKTLDTVEDRFPVPAAGESVKRFFGKVLTFLRNIRPLTGDITLYVSANTGSDVSGDGSQAKPFKTIQHAIDLVPKDLNGCVASITIANGTYPEDLKIKSFKGGQLYIHSTTTGGLNANCIVQSFDIYSCFASIYIETITMNEGDQNAITVDTSMYVILRYIKSVRTNLSKTSIIIQTSRCLVADCELSNHAYAIYCARAEVDAQNNYGSGNSVAYCSDWCATIAIIPAIPTGVTSTAQSHGGRLIQDNGTQISGLITSGLSCTWGTIYGGYIRHGNMNGVAMVTVQAQIAPSHTLTAGTDYLMPGFPTNAYTSVCVTVSPQRLASNCYISTSGTLSFAPMQDLQIGDSIALNCTYITNS